ncbi:unnamed protein product [Durusdinium trenchii]|uniref:Uncharacterized protein n=1 Tax=Durusdinium trenchii TaxID=1381693 RepID=A0ABP0H4N5_9DINO
MAVVSKMSRPSRLPLMAGASAAALMAVPGFVTPGDVPRQMEVSHGGAAASAPAAAHRSSVPGLAAASIAMGATAASASRRKARSQKSAVKVKSSAQESLVFLTWWQRYRICCRPRIKVAFEM